MLRQRSCNCKCSFCFYAGWTLLRRDCRTVQRCCTWQPYVKDVSASMCGFNLDKVPIGHLRPLLCVLAMLAGMRASSRQSGSSISARVDLSSHLAYLPATLRSFASELTQCRTCASIVKGLLKVRVSKGVSTAPNAQYQEILTR